MRYLLLLVLIVVLSNCTIHKRVHRKGWYVEWHKSYKADRNRTTQEREEIAAAAIEEEVVQPANISSAKEAPSFKSSEEESKTTKLTQHRPSGSRDRDVNPNVLVEHSEDATVDVEKVASTEPQEALKNTTITTSSKSRSRGNGNAARVFLILGAVFLAIGLIAFALGFLATELGGALLAIAFMALFGGVGIILLLVGLILLLLA